MRILHHFFLLLVYSKTLPVNGIISIPGLQSGCGYVYYNPGDVNLGFITHVHKPLNDEQWCGKDIFGTALKYVEAFRYAIEQVNRNTALMPNITLGWVILDACATRDAYFARALQMLPDSVENNATKDTDTDVCDDSGRPRNYDVAAVVGPSQSDASIFTTYALGLAHIPMISPMATTDELNDESRFPYFARLVPPDKHQAEAMVDVALYFNWTYVSVLYSEGPYGENGAKNLEKQIRRKGLCKDVSYMISSDSTQTSFTEVATLLHRHKKARVIFAFLVSNDIKNLFDALEDLGLVNHFIFIFSDSAIRTEHKVMSGGFIINHIYKESQSFTEYYLGLTPANNQENPWMRRFWEDLFDCSWKEPPSNDSCHAYETTTKYQYVGPYVTKTLDSTRVLALGLHDLLSTKCPKVFQNKNLLKSCITGEDYINHIKNVSFEGESGMIKFDENGNMLGTYNFEQIIYNTSSDTFSYIKAGYWDNVNDILQMNDEDLNWNIFNGTWDNLPESVCSKPCPMNEYYVRSELPCCWECKRCRGNEIVVNQNKCEQCNLTTWPDEETETKCQPIPPTYLRWNKLAIILALLEILGVIFTIIVSGLMVLNRKAKLIRASSKELNAIILMGILVAYISVFFHLIKPSKWPCLLRHAGFNIAVSMIYAPILTNTNRVYRIFSAGKRGVKRPAFISNGVQRKLTCFLVGLQVFYSFQYDTYTLIFQCFQI